MLAKLKKNFPLWDIDDNAIVDFEILEYYCPVCKKKRDFLKILDHRPIVEEDDKYAYRWDYTQLILVYNEPSPRGRLGERRRHIPSDAFGFDFNINKTNIFGIVTHYGYEIKFLRARRYYNTKLWHVEQACHIYEDAFNSVILWMEKRKNSEFVDNFLIKQVEIHDACAIKYSVGCKTLYEGGGILYYIDDNKLAYEFEADHNYEKTYLDEIFKTDVSGFIDEFNNKSHNFKAILDNGLIKLSKK